MDDERTLLARRSVTSRLQRGRAKVGRWGQPATSAAIIAANTLLCWFMLMWPDNVPFSAYVPVAVVAGLFLTPKVLAGVDLAILVAGAWTVVEREVSAAILAAYGVLTLVMLIMFWVAASRARLGVQGNLGESMLVDLRDRLRTQGELPELPTDWGAELSVLSAYGDSFSGDFLVTSRHDDVLELALVDVSGKGIAAGTRSLLLSGAFGGLLGSMPYEAFLPAANSYLLRQAWDEGFATAAHAMIDLTTGDFSLGSAGHPPGVRFSAGSGRWEVLEGDEGPVLGVTQGLAFPRVRGRLGRGDALLLYTDGVIEVRNRDLRDGIDRMLGTAERMIGKGFEGMAEKVCAAARAGETDDRAAVVVWRR
ncbi:Stage II sporulation protein E (SpoIIE) [Pedococcus dokdonensis]|uniref:Stage II sporulation protein E (SpoIIE) n=1 Tax=Pedococcus dokdonensis TaxID=443156 RepID=A0A1H0QHE9_9MICO|nr:PP2C family protein-serine/threonine phosphatase [Pedococcus dokdonensis]SDP16098.1 Stage II sporulation protein E (SpoIIE) [Pedococcus dokdonensis]